MCYAPVLHRTEVCQFALTSMGILSQGVKLRHEFSAQWRQLCRVFRLAQFVIEAVVSRTPYEPSRTMPAIVCEVTWRISLGSRRHRHANGLWVSIVVVATHGSILYEIIV